MTFIFKLFDGRADCRSAAFGLYDRVAIPNLFGIERIRSGRSPKDVT